MPYTPSPLRYPGGKTQLYNYIVEILSANCLQGQTYVESFAGGAGLAIKLLLNNKVDKIVINDIDPAIYAFWHCVLNESNQFCNLIRRHDISVIEREKQRKIYLGSCETTDKLALGFAAFYLNRTNVSGVLKGGVIGGLNQDGPNKINARYNKERLIQRITRIAERRNDIEVSNIDAKVFLKSAMLKYKRNIFINFDPPYVGKGSQLYTNAFQEKDHVELSKEIIRSDRKWIVTYDTSSLILDLYKNFRYRMLDINYSIGPTKNAKEYIFFSNSLAIPDEIPKAI